MVGSNDIRVLYGFTGGSNMMFYGQVTISSKVMVRTRLRDSHSYILTNGKFRSTSRHVGIGYSDNSRC